MKHLFVVGFMGSGKTTVGALLAQRMQRPFIDTDLRIEQREGLSIPDLFTAKGEPYFRHLEEDVIRQIANEPPAVVALGGGAVVSAENRRLLRESGTTIWLDVPLDEIRERGLSVETRPLFENPAQVEELYRQRVPLYRDCGIRIDARRKTPQAITALICRIVDGPS